MLISGLLYVLRLYETAMPDFRTRQMLHMFLAARVQDLSPTLYKSLEALLHATSAQYTPVLLDKDALLGCFVFEIGQPDKDKLSPMRLTLMHLIL